MTKAEFLYILRDRLSGLPKDDIEKSLDYYSEMIDDRIEDGLTEEAAVEAVGSIEEIVSQIFMEASLPKLVKEKVKSGKALKAWEIILLILGSCVWLPLLVSAVIVVLTVYIVIWVVIASLYVADFSVAVYAIDRVFTSVVLMVNESFVTGAFYLGTGFACVGAAILLFFCFNQITKAAVWISKKILLSIKSRFIKKEKAQ